MRYHIAKYYGWIIFILALLEVAYKAAYIDLNPSNFQWQDAIIQAFLALMAFITYHNHIQAEFASVNGQLDTLDRLPRGDGGPSTQRVPSIDPRG